MRSVHDRLIRVTAAAALPTLAVLALAGCGTDEPGTGGQESTPAGSPSQTPSTVATPKGSGPSNTADPSGETADVNIDVTIAGGKVSPSTQTVKANAGQTVKITVTSDVEDQLHVHGYDKEVDLMPGKPGSVTFTADIKGTFEIETHESGKLLAKLVVS
jgi:heme/copper-type cytochrome/quinol oxidase subunit 2